MYLDGYRARQSLVGPSAHCANTKTRSGLGGLRTKRALGYTCMYLDGYRARQSLVGPSAHCKYHCTDISKRGCG